MMDPTDDAPMPHDQHGVVAFRGDALVSGVLEQMAFLLPTGEVPSGPCVWARVVHVPWCGPDGSEGRVEVAFDAGTMDGIVANLVIQPQDPSDAEAALCEVANVVAGNLLPAIYGGDHEFHLGAPACLTDATTSGRCEADVVFVEGRVAVLVDGDRGNTRILCKS